MASRSVPSTPASADHAAWGAGHHCQRCSGPASPVPRRGRAPEWFGPRFTTGPPRQFAQAMARSCA
eukprot:8964360-Lingulodinium_polyedra.AAC.1